MDVVKDFVKGCRRLQPARPRFPSWDLTIVLQQLGAPPFEPMSEDRLRYVTMKVAFLVAVTTARRLGEIQALSIAPGFFQQEVRGTWLRLNPFFVTKVPTMANRESEIFLKPFHPVRYRRSASTLTRSCVSRAIRQYLKVTEQFRKSQQLFVCYHGRFKGQAASKTTIARWIKDCVWEAYKLKGLVPPRIKAHSTRGQAATVAELRGVSIQDICSSATWGLRNTFAKHYQLNMAPDTASSRFADGVLSSVQDQR